MCGPHRGRFRAVNLSASGSLRVRDRPARRHVHAPLRLRHLRPRPDLLPLLLRGPARQGRRRADPAARRSRGPGSRRSRARSPRRSRSARSAATRCTAIAPGRGGAAGRHRLLAARRRRAAQRRAGGSTAPTPRSSGELLREPRAATPQARPRPERGQALPDAGRRRSPRRSPTTTSTARRPTLELRTRTARSADADASTHVDGLRQVAAGPRPRRRAADAVRRDRVAVRADFETGVTVEATREEIVDPRARLDVRARRERL